MNSAGLKISVILMIFIFSLLGCDNPSAPVSEKPKPAAVQKKILPPAPATIEKTQPLAVSDKKAVGSEENKPVMKEPEKSPETLVPVDLNQETELSHYDARGKIDPFIPLIQETVEETPAVEETGPKRILTPLEKIDLSKIRLVAVLQMQDRSIAMVEEASGKGYEVKIGTYIGKRQGRVAEIKDASIVVKEPVRDFKGQLKEQVHEIKLHKLSDGE